MMIRVKYPNGTTGMVRPTLLTQLIRSQKIVEFRRAEGWVVLGEGRIRGNHRTDFEGEDRRQAV